MFRGFFLFLAEKRRAFCRIENGKMKIMRSSHGYYTTMIFCFGFSCRVQIFLYTCTFVELQIAGIRGNERRRETKTRIDEQEVKLSCLFHKSIKLCIYLKQI